MNDHRKPAAPAAATTPRFVRRRPPEDPEVARRRELYEARLCAGPLGNAWTRPASVPAATPRVDTTDAYNSGLRAGLAGCHSDECRMCSCAAAHALGWSVGAAHYEARVRLAAERGK